MNLSALLPFTSAVCCFALAVAAMLRAGRSVDRWSFAAGMAALAVEGTLAGLSAGATSPDAMVRWQQWRLLAVSVLPATWLLFSLSFSRGSEQKRFSVRLLPWAGAIIVSLGFVIIFWDGLFVSWHRLTDDNDWLFRMGWPALVLHAILLIISVAVLMNLERTFRASVGTMRWRIKFIILGIGLIFVARLYTSSQATLFRVIDPSLESLNPAAVVVGCLLVLRSFSRAGHLDLQVYPSQSVLQGSLTALLAGIYLLIVGVLAKVVTFWGGDATFAFKTFLILVLLVLLALLLQSDHVRSSIRQFVSRHFRRPLYDYRAVWRTFTEGTAKRMEQTDLCRALAKLVADVFQTLSVTIWLVDETSGQVTFGASTSLPTSQGSDQNAQTTDMAEIIRYFHAHPEPVEFETLPDNWAATLRAWHPAEFPNGGNRVCIPIMSRGEVLGLITVGDRVGGEVFGLQDFEMLRCIAEHAAANLLNAQLSQKLLETKEKESFQKMAAFFVHDLKNAASTLNLMLKNLPVHFDDPTFREDALRGIAKTVGRIKDLTGCLNTLRQEMKVTPVEADLNDLITNAVAAVQLGPGVVLTKDLTPLAKFPLDRDQIGKVLVNILLNAGESMEGRGQLRIGSGKSDGWAVVTVTDTGCGMSADFVRHSLFHPFQTTKKTGLGIGMFQCKAIMDAHGGKITVASEPGKGTTFEVFLPTGGPMISNPRLSALASRSPGVGW
jgi:putative PEP-CTERM system histidine kinase